MRSHTQSVGIEPNRRRITGSISYKPLISDISVLIVCNKTGGTIKGDKKNCMFFRCKIIKHVNLLFDQLIYLYIWIWFSAFRTAKASIFPSICIILSELRTNTADPAALHLCFSPRHFVLQEKSLKNDTEDTRWFKYDRDWFVCKQAAMRSSCATLRDWSHNLHPPFCSG